VLVEVCSDLVDTRKVSKNEKEANDDEIDTQIARTKHWKTKGSGFPGNEQSAISETAEER
jgi:hypothetical protein